MTTFRSSSVNRALVVVAGILVAVLLTIAASRGIKEPFESWHSDENGKIMSVYFTNAKTTLPAGTDTQITGWAATSNYFSPSLKSFTPAHFLNSTGGITFPVNGLYTINYSTRFNTVSTSTQNAMWLTSINGTYGSGPVNVNTVRLSQSEGFGLIDGNVSFTGYFSTTDVVQPYAWSNVANSVGAPYGGSNLSISLIAQ